MRRAWLPLGAALVAVAGTWWLWPTSLPGFVASGERAMVGAVVRVQGQNCSFLTDSQGRFQLPPGSRGSKRITAWKPGYAIGSIPPYGDLSRLQLLPLPAVDNDDYAWIDPTPNPKEPNNCGNCHAEIHREWSLSAHAKSSTNRRVLDAFTALAKARPDDTGVCAKCHAPTMRDPTLDYDLRKVEGIDKHGVHCDYCHKVTDVPSGKFGTRFGNDGMQLLRPPHRQLLSFGPLDDAVREGEQFGHSPIYKDSRYCASCHEGVVYGVHVYGTYSEWLESPARKQGKQCQTCHMAPTGKMTNIAPGKGGIERDPRTLGSHLMAGATKEMLKRCLSVKVTIVGNEVQVEVKADNVGHRVPTGSPDHSLELEIRTSEEKVSAVSGSVWFPVLNKVFAKQFSAPKADGPVPFWLAQGEPKDTRLFPGKADRLRFTLPDEANTVWVQLIYWPYQRDPNAFYAVPPDGYILVFNKVIPCK